MATRDGGEIKIRIAGDSSDLENASARAAKALGDVGGSAAKAGKGVDKAGTKMVSNSRRMAKLSDSAENTKDEFGEMSSSAAALGAALDFIDPRLGTAARGLGDMAGAAEGAVRMTKLQGGALSAVLHPGVLAVTAAVGAMGGAYFLLTKEIKAANEKIEAQDARMASILPKYQKLKIASLQLLVAQEKMTSAEMASIVAREGALTLFEPEKKAAQEKLQIARDELKQADDRLKIAQTSAQMNSRHEASAEAAAQKVAMLTERERERFENAQQQVQSLQDEIKGYDEATGALIRKTEETVQLTQAAKKQRKATKGAAEATEDFAAALRAAQEESAALMASLEDEGDAIDQIRQAQDAMITAREDAFIKEMQAIDALAGKAEEKEERFVSAELSMQEDMAAIRANFREEEVAALDEMEQANRDHLDRIAADALAKDAEIKAAIKANHELAISYGAEMSTALVDVASQRMTALMESGEALTEQQKEQAQIQFRIIQAASAAQALIDGYAGAAKAVATYGMPAALPFIGLAIAAAATQVALIKASPPPSFATGGMVPGSGEVPITAHGGEGVLTAGTTASLGGAGAISALNNGDITGQLGQIAANTNGLAGQIAGALDSRPVQVQVTLGHKQFDKFIAADLKRPKSELRRAIGSR